MPRLIYQVPAPVKVFQGEDSQVDLLVQNEDGSPHSLLDYQGVVVEVTSEQRGRVRYSRHDAYGFVTLPAQTEANRITIPLKGFDLSQMPPGELRGVLKGINGLGAAMQSPTFSLGYLYGSDPVQIPIPTGPPVVLPEP